MRTKRTEQGRFVRAPFVTGDKPVAPSYDLLEAVLDSSPFPTILIELNGTMSFMSKRACALFGMERGDDCDDAEGMPWVTLYPVAHVADLAERLHDACQGVTGDIEIALPAPQSQMEMQWWHITLSPVASGEETVRRILCVMRDVSNRRQNETRQRLIAEDALADADQQRGIARHAVEDADTRMREIDHRMKNSLATISSLLRLQARAADDGSVREALDDASLRVMSVGQVHERLYQSADMDDALSPIDMQTYLGPLAQDIVGSLGGSNITLLTEVDDIVMPSRHALEIGLIVTELVVNAIRHAFPDGQGGLINLIMRRNETGQTIVRVCDTGRGLPDGFDFSRSRGIGARVVSLYSRSLDGRLLATNAPEGGAVFELIFPV